jgi:DNA topoisomerase I
MKVRHGRYGAFLGCTNYPECRGIVNIPKRGEAVLNPSDMPACPAVGCDGNMVARKSRFGKTFYSCSTFPNCDVIVNDLSELSVKYPDHPKTAYVKKERRGRPKKEAEAGAKGEKGEKPKVRKTRISKPKKLSEALSAVVGETSLSRGEAMKKIWDYIKAHNLQDPANKRRILPDAALAKVFGNNEPLDMFHLAGVLSKHLE